MNKEQLYHEIGLIDEDLIAAAERIGGEKEKEKRGISKKWVILIASLVIYSSTATALLATSYMNNQNSEPYIRYLTAESLELQPVTQYDPNKFLQALKSDNNEHIYIAINRLIESFNDQKMSEKALKEIRPFIDSENEKIADVAVFAVDILSKSYESPYLIKLADGSIIFTLFNQYSDYGSQNVIWRIKDNVLEQYLSFSTPSMYITNIIPSPDRNLIAIVTNSNKSEFVQVYDVKERRISPELIESSRVKYGAQHNIETWIRTDHENYSGGINHIAWSNNNTLQFEGFLAYDDTAIIESVMISYQYSERVLEVKKLDEA